MMSLKRAAQKSLDARSHPKTLEHRQNVIAKTNHPVKRLGLRAIHSAAMHQPKATAKLFHATTYPEGVLVLPSGAQSDVFLIDSETVLKVVKSSIKMTSRERRNYACALRDEHNALRHFVGNAVLPHTIDIGPNPLISGKPEVILITQEYRNVNFVPLVEEPDRPLLRHTVDKTERTHPGAKIALLHMLAGSRKLYEHDLAMDIIGDNVGFDNSSSALTIVDGQPVTIRDEKVLREMPYRFDELELAIVSTS